LATLNRIQSVFIDLRDMIKVALSKSRSTRSIGFLTDLLPPDAFVVNPSLQEDFEKTPHPLSPLQGCELIEEA
jgi:hypothetical protein